MIKTQPLSKVVIASMARKFREKYNIPSSEAFPILDILYDMFDEGLLSIQVLEDDDPYFSEGVVALYNVVDNFIYIKESTLREIDEGIYRSNFTLAHELFHFIQFRVHNFEITEAPSVKAFEDPEWQANYFAGCLLLPADHAFDGTDEYLSEHYKISIECASTRQVQVKNEQRGAKIKWKH